MHKCKPRPGRQTPYGWVSRPSAHLNFTPDRPQPERNPLRKYFHRHFWQTAIINATLTSKTHRTSSCAFAIEKSTTRNGALLRLGKHRLSLLANAARIDRIRLSQPERILRTRRKAMSQRNGDKSRFHRERKQNIQRRIRTRELLHMSAATAAQSVPSRKPDSTTTARAASARPA